MLLLRNPNQKKEKNSGHSRIACVRVPTAGRPSPRRPTGGCRLAPASHPHARIRPTCQRPMRRSRPASAPTPGARHALPGAPRRRFRRVSGTATIKEPPEIRGRRIEIVARRRAVSRGIPAESLAARPEWRAHVYSASAWRAICCALTSQMAGSGQADRRRARGHGRRLSRRTSRGPRARGGPPAPRRPPTRRPRCSRSRARHPRPAA